MEALDTANPAASLAASPAKAEKAEKDAKAAKSPVIYPVRNPAKAAKNPARNLAKAAKPVTPKNNIAFR